MRKTTITKILSLIIVIGMLFSITPITARAENATPAVAVQAFPNAEIKLSGVIKDGGILEGDKHGYPLYAKITLTGGDAPLIFYSDPFTGAYEVMIEDEVEYTIQVEPLLPGYIPAIETFTATEALTKNYDLNISASCSAPGYRPEYNQYWDFETDEQGFTFGGTNSSWAHGEITSGPGAAHSGTKGIATNPAGDYNLSEQSWAMSPVIDLSSVGDDVAFIEYWNWLFTESATSTWDVASVEFTANGTVWETVWGPEPRQDTEWSKQLIIIDEEFYTNAFQFRFWFKSDFSGNRAGWYIDDIGIGWVPLNTDVETVAAFYFDGADNEEEWTTGKTGTGENSWEKGAPTSGPGAAHSDPNVWATNLDGPYNADEVSYITSPTINLSDYAGMGIRVNYYDWLYTESRTSVWDHGRIYASNDNGATFTLIQGNILRQDTVDNPNYTSSFVDLSSDYTTAGFQFRFEFKSDFSGHYAGWYIDNVVFGVKESLAVPCGPVPGAIVAGYVYDLNELDEDIIILDALVESPSARDTTKLRPNDENHDGLYYFYQDLAETSEEITFTVSKEFFGTINDPRTIVADQVNRQDFRIGSGWIVSEEDGFERVIFLGDDDEFDTLHLSNVGAFEGSWSLTEHDMGFVPLGVSIPAFTGELPERTEPVSMFRDPKLGTETGPVTLELNSNAADFGITEAPEAYGIELQSDQLWHWADLTAPGSHTSVGSVPTQLFAGDFLKNDYSKLYAISYANNNLYTIDTTNGSSAVVANVPVPASGTTYGGLAGANGFFYGAATECNVQSWLTKIELDGTMTTIGKLNNATCIIDIAYVPSENMLYGVDLVTASLYKIDPNTGADTLVGGLGASPNYAQGMDYDEENNILYWASYIDGSGAQLRVIDMETGASALIGSFAPNTEIDSYAVKAYAGGGGGGGPVPWLDETPVEGTIQPGETMAVQLQFTVNGVIDQPGDYFAELHFTSDTPKDIAPIPVVLHVWRPYDFGNVKGTVIATEKCDLNPAPLAEATINFYFEGELHASTETDENGYFSYALKAGTYDLEIEMEGYVTTRIDGVKVLKSDDTYIDIEVRHDSACLTVSPEFVYQEQYPDQIRTQVLTFTNIGAADAVFEIAEVPGDSAVPYELNLPEFTGTLPEKTGTLSMEAKPNALPSTGGGITLNEKAFELGITEVVGAFGAHVFPDPQKWVKWEDVSVPGAWQQIANLNLAQPFAGDFLGNDFENLYVVDNATRALYKVKTDTGAAEQVRVLSITGETFGGITGADGFFYGIIGGCGDSQTLFKLTPEGDVEIIGGLPSSPCAIDLAYVPADGMIYYVDLLDDTLYRMDPTNPSGATPVGNGLGYDANYAQGMDYDEVNGILYWAACSDDEFAQLRVIDMTSGSSVKIGDFPSGEVDAFAIAGSSGGGGGEPGDIPWLTEDPTAGVVFADGGTVEVTLTFDSTDLVWGDYFGTLRVANDPDPKIEIPVQLRVLPFNMLYLPLIQIHFYTPAK